MDFFFLVFECIFNIGCKKKQYEVNIGICLNEVYILLQFELYVCVWIQRGGWCFGLFLEIYLNKILELLEYFLDIYCVKVKYLLKFLFFFREKIEIMSELYMCIVFNIYKIVFKIYLYLFCNVWRLLRVNVKILNSKIQIINCLINQYCLNLIVICR